MIRQFVGLGLDAGDTQDKFQEPNSKNQETRRSGDTLRWRHAGQVPRAKFQEPRGKETGGHAALKNSMTQ